EIERSCRGDIETIAAKALEKDKARRYSSAAELGADIRRYLNCEPIVARPATMSYKLTKFARRHKVVFAAAAVVCAVLIAGTIFSAREAAMARRAQSSALVARDRAAEAARVAEIERDRALEAERAADAARSQALQERNRALAEEHRANTETLTARAID